MFLRSIDQKPKFTRPDGIVVRDLTDSMFNLRNKNYVTYNVYRVPRDYVMRPDLISKVVYNNSLYAEMILKYNGISNPFSINEGDIILIPNLESTQANIKKRESKTATSGANTIRNSYKYIDPTKIPKKTSELQNFDNRNIGNVAETSDQIGTAGLTSAQQVSVGSGALPPNIAEEGSTQITYRNGRVYFGDSTATCLKSGSSVSEFLVNVIKSKS
jgi:hypothetical protein